MLALSVAWLLKTIKYILFWLYLWQLKEYHVGRFRDHFRTKKGRRAFFHSFFWIELVLLILFLLVGNYYRDALSIVLLAIYLFQVAVFSRHILKRSLKKPVKTAKSLLLLIIALGITGGFFLITLGENPIWLLLFDLLVPFIASAVVLLLQPFSVWARNAYVNKARQAMDQFTQVRVVAITGSYGKTSTKEFLATLLAKKYKVLATKNHQNSEIAIAKTVLNDLHLDHQIFIAEVGAYNKGKVAEVCSVLRPAIGVVTGVNEQHLSLFGSLENLLSAEGGGELDASLGKNGLLIVNGDNQHCLQLYKKSQHKKKLYSFSHKALNADIWAEDVHVDKEYVSFITKNQRNEIGHFRVPVLGRHHIQNLLGAILTAQELGMKMGDITEAAKHIQQTQGGMSVWKTSHGISVIDASYSANPDGVVADLEYLSLYEGKRVIVMPSLIELGKESKRIHEMLGKKIAAVCDMAIITTEDYFTDIKRGALAGGMNANDMLLCEKSDDIHALVTLFIKSGDTVLLEGRVPQKVITLLQK